MTQTSKEMLYKFLREHPYSRIADIGGDASVYANQTPLPEVTIFDMESGFDICTATLPGLFSTIVCMDVFEHIVNPFEAARNICASLAPGGWLFLTTVFKWPIHNYPIDTYRYTDQILKILFLPLKIENCWFCDDYCGEELLPDARVSIIAQKP